jgi:hypothetical protein
MEINVTFGLNAAFTARVDQVLRHYLRPCRDAVSIKLALPIITRNGKIMSNYELVNDAVVDIMITTIDAAGNLVPPPPSDVFTVVSSDMASLNAIIGTMPSGPFAGKTSLRINALVALKPGLTATISDSAGLTTDVLTIDIVADPTPKAITLDLVDAVLTPQAVPAA